MNYLKILFFIIFLSSCGKALLTEESLIKEAGFTDNSTRYYIYPKTLPGFLSTEYYKIKAYLNTEDSYLVLFSHFNGFKIEDGIQIKIERNKKDLIIKTLVQSDSWKLLLQQKSYFLNNSEIDFTVEVKNGTSKGAFIRVWENFRTKNNAVKLERQIVTEETLLTDTENINFYKQGEGLKWGLKLFRSQLVKAVRAPPPVL